MLSVHPKTRGFLWSSTARRAAGPKFSGRLASRCCKVWLTHGFLSSPRKLYFVLGLDGTFSWSYSRVIHLGLVSTPHFNGPWAASGQLDTVCGSVLHGSAWMAICDSKGGRLAAGQLDLCLVRILWRSRRGASDRERAAADLERAHSCCVCCVSVLIDWPQAGECSAAD